MSITRKYFQKFPSISYNDYVVRDVSARAKLTQYIADAGIALLPYTVKDGERADSIAATYYEDPYYSWAIYLANAIIDPYEDWPKDQQTFLLYLDKRYGSFEKAQDIIVRYEVNWAEDSTILSPAQYAALPTENKKYWEPDFGFNKEIISWHRREVDWVIDNNRFDRLYVVASNTFVNSLSFTLDERLYQYNFTDIAAVKSTLVGIEDAKPLNYVTLDSDAGDITFTNNSNVLTVKGTLNLVPTAPISGDNIIAGTYITHIANSTAVFISQNTIGTANSTYLVTNPATANLVVKQVDFKPVVFASNSTLAVPNTFFTYEATGPYQDEDSYLVGRTSTSNVIVLSHERLDTAPVPNALLANSKLSINELVYWKSVNAYDDEVQKNEKKKEILVLDKNLINQLDDALAEIVKNGG